MKKFLFFFVFKDNCKPALSSQVAPLKRKYLGYNKRLIPGSKHAIVVKRVKTKIAVQSEQRWILSWWERCLLRKWGKKEACSHSFSLTQLWAVEQLSVSASSSPECLSEKLSTCTQEQGHKRSSTSSIATQQSCFVLPLGWEHRAQSHCLCLSTELRSSLHLLCQELFWHSFFQFNCSRIFQKHFTIILYQKSKSWVL